MIIVDEKRRSMGSAPPMLKIHVQHKAEGGEIEDEGMEDYQVLASEILEAIQARDPAALADSLYAFFQQCDMEPHEEGPHENG